MLMPGFGCFDLSLQDEETLVISTEVLKEALEGGVDGENCRTGARVLREALKAISRWQELRRRR